MARVQHSSMPSPILYFLFDAMGIGTGTCCLFCRLNCIDCPSQAVTVTQYLVNASIRIHHAFFFIIRANTSGMFCTGPSLCGRLDSPWISISSPVMLSFSCNVRRCHTAKHTIRCHPTGQPIRAYHTLLKGNPVSATVALPSNFLQINPTGDRPSLVQVHIPSCRTKWGWKTSSLSMPRPTGWRE